MLVRADRYAFLIAAATLTFTAGCGETRCSDCGSGPLWWAVDGSVDSDDGGPAFNDATLFDVQVNDADAAEVAGDAGDAGDANGER